MAELVLSALLPVLFEKLASEPLKNIARYRGVDAEIKKWQRSLKQIQSVLNDASRKEITNESVKRWLNDLQHLVYDIDDVLDELATEAMHRQFTRESETIATKVRNLIPSCCTSFSKNSMMFSMLDTISAKVEDLVKEKSDLGLRVEEESGPINRNRSLQTSMVHASSIVGRDSEKEALVLELLRDEPSDDQNFNIVPIVGIGGVGKTTLARLLYNEKQVKDHFELMAWVCVSDDFDSFAISKVIFQSVTGENKDFADLNLLQVALKDHLRGKIFLLVLDDVWSESCEDWETLVGPFYACAPGSKIIMTTRKDVLLRKMGCNHVNHLERLSRDDALSLFALHALGVNNFDSHLSLKPHVVGIVKKCDGLPLALKALGRLLSRKKDEEYWKKVLDSEIWNLPVQDEIIPALKLSYHDLSARLKQLFAYCSLFPKDCVFDKEELILLWMGEGFLHQSNLKDSTEENMGHEYFDELLSRSFFQHAPNNESLFVMHDMMNDLATYVASEFFVRLDPVAKKGIGKEISEKCRHMSFVRQKYVTYQKFDTIKRANSVRTFMATSVGVVKQRHYFYLSNKILVDLIPQYPLLKVLCLINFEICEVPETIGTLRHLRYLNLSQTMITHLPEKVCNLYNLQTLIVAGCRRLAKLPSNIVNLKNLRHLDVRDTPSLVQMPLGIGELQSLQTLSKIIIGGEGKFELAKLKDMENLCGEISILGLDKVKDATDAREANFSQNRLCVLKLSWSGVLDCSRNESLEKDVLNELKPCSDYLKRLKIRSYGGLEFPKWVGHPSFLRLYRVSILGCKRLTYLPPLGQLPSLKELSLKGLDGVKVVGLELFGTGHAFPALKLLSFEDMGGWEKWSTSSGVVFPCLEMLIIGNCPHLVEVTLETLPSLNVLEIYNCGSGVLRRVVEVAPALTKLRIQGISGLNDVVWRGVIENLATVEELRIQGCNEIRYLWESEVVVSMVLLKLRILEVAFSGNLVSLGEKEEADNCRTNHLTSLKTLKVSFCKNMVRCSCPDSVENLEVASCDSMTTISLPTIGLNLKSLSILSCTKLLGKEWGGQNMNINKMLKNVSICYWQDLKSITDLNYLVHLTHLKIESCVSLESFPDNELPNLTSLKELRVTDCPSLDASFGFWPPSLQSLTIGKLKKPVSKWGRQNFPNSLVELSLYGGDDEVSSCSQFSHLIPSSLTYLLLSEFEKLESVSMRLQHLTSLKHLVFNECPKMMDLPQVLLPSLLSLRINHCPNLKERYSKRGGYWHLISHIPCIVIYPQPLS